MLKTDENARDINKWKAPKRKHLLLNAYATVAETSMAAGRCFHPHLSGHEAEKLLMEEGTDGSFLVWPGLKARDLTLSVKQNGKAMHIRIQNTGDFFDLYGGEKFETLFELIQYYMENDGQLKENKGDFIHLKYPIISETPTPERWFHGHISGKDAEKCLMEKGKNGSYLVRKSQSKPGDFVLSVRCEDKVTHVKIRYHRGKYDVGVGEQFPTLSELVEHYYKKNPMMMTSGTVLVVLLKLPFYATRIIASCIDSRIKQLQTEKENGKNGFWDEFEQLQQQEVRHLYSRKEGMRPENISKNRYRTILPFDHTRVILRDGDQNTVGADYINANTITSGDDSLEPKKTYIATQGCLPQTVADLWRMAWQENSRVIVMATSEDEIGDVHYWPEPNAEDPTRLVTVPQGKITIKLLSSVKEKDYITRVMEVNLVTDDKEETRIIHQYHFHTWPDNGVPRDTDSFLKYLQVVNHQQEISGNTGPTVVQCSDGVGRTGTLIVIDIILNKIKVHGFHCDIDIQKTVQMVRSQRWGMVQTEAQYKFVYLTVMQFIDTKRQRRKAEQPITRFTTADIDARFKELEKMNDTDNRSGFEDEFEILRRQEVGHFYSLKEGMRAENASKNRYLNILPYDITRVVLRDGDPNTPGSDYINANIITPVEGGSDPRKTYIATQGCLPQTVADFWRMVWQENSRVIVMATTEVEKGEYWPEPNAEDPTRLVTVPQGKITIKLLSSVKEKDYITRVMEVNLVTDDKEETREIHQYQFHTWPDFDVPIDTDSFLKFLHVVNHQQEESNNTGPIIVQCSDGVGRTGTFIVINIILNQIKDSGFDCDIDIQKTIHMVRSQRVMMVQTEAQYKFVYLAVLHFMRMERERETDQVEQESLPLLQSEVLALFDYEPQEEEEIKLICGQESLPLLQSEVLALFDYEPEEEVEIELIRGQRIKLIRKVDENWWMGEHNGKRGMFPSNYVKEIDPE